MDNQLLKDWADGFRTYGLSSGQFYGMSESARLNVSDEVTGELLRFITTKYNELDFSEIEKSKGSFKNFKYKDVILDNLDTLESIYKAHDSKIYDDYIKSCRIIINHLTEQEKNYSYAYLKEIGILQLNYVTMITTVIYTISILITATVRFISIDNTSEIEVIVEDLSKHANYVFLKNCRAYAGIIQTGEMNKMISAFITTSQNMNESLVVSTTLLPMLAVPVVVFLLFRLIPIIREVIFAVYFLRIKVTDALDLQIELLKTNIESLEDGSNKNKKKIIAKQRSIVNGLTAVRNVFMVKIEKAEVQMRREIKEEDKEIEKKIPGYTPSKSPEVMI